MASSTTNSSSQKPTKSSGQSLGIGSQADTKSQYGSFQEKLHTPTGQFTPTAQAKMSSGGGGGSSLPVQQPKTAAEIVQEIRQSGGSYQDLKNLAQSQIEARQAQQQAQAKAQQAQSQRAAQIRELRNSTPYHAELQAKIRETHAKQQYQEDYQKRILNTLQQQGRIVSIEKGVLSVRERQGDLNREAQQRALKQDLEPSPTDVILRAGIETGSVKSLKQIKEAYGNQPKTFGEQFRQSETEQSIIDKYSSPHSYIEHLANLWLHPKEVEAARREQVDIAIAKGDKTKRLLLGLARPSTYVAEHKIETGIGLATGFIAGPTVSIASGISSKIPIIGTAASKALSSPITWTTVGGLWAGSEGYKAGVKERANPQYYKGIGGKVELFSEPLTQFTAFAAGADLYKGSKMLPIKIKEFKLSSLVKGKTPPEAVDILKQRGYYNDKQIPGMIKEQIGTTALSTNARVQKPNVPTIKSILEETGLVKTGQLSTQLKVKELEGFTGTRTVRAQGGKLEITRKYNPEFSKPYLIEPKDIQQPDAFMLKTQAERTGRVLPPSFKTKTGKELIDWDSYFQVGKESKYLVPNKLMSKFVDKRVDIEKLGIDSNINLREFGTVKGKFEGFDYNTYRSSNFRIPNKQPRLEKGGLFRLSGITDKPKVGFTPKLTAPDIVEDYYPLINLETDEALGSIKVSYNKAEGWKPKSTFITAGKGKEPKIWRGIKTPEQSLSKSVSKDIETLGKSDQVSVQKLKPQITVGVKLKSTAQSTESKLKFYPPFSNFNKGSNSKQGQQSKSTFESVYKKKGYTVFEKPKLKTESPFSDVFTSSKSKLNSIIGAVSIKKSGLNRALNFSPISKSGQSQGKQVGIDQDVASKQSKISLNDLSNAVDNMMNKKFDTLSKSRLMPKSPTPLKNFIPKMDLPKPSKIPQFDSRYNPFRKYKFKEPTKKPSYTPTLIGGVFFKPIKATKELSQRAWGGSEIRPLAIKFPKMPTKPKKPKRRFWRLF